MSLTLAYLGLCKGSYSAASICCYFLLTFQFCQREKMLQLPVELQRQCLDYLKDDITTLTAARLVNRELGITASEVLFSTLLLVRSDESAERFTQFAQSSLKDLARRVIISAVNLDTASYKHLFTRPELKVLESFAAALPLLQEMSNVDEVHLVFSEDCNGLCDRANFKDDVTETVYYREDVLKAVFPVLRHVDKLKSLTIRNLQDYMDADLFNSEDFVTVRGKLKELHLCITTDASGDLSLPDLATEPSLQKGFRDQLPYFWLEPLNNQLTNLSLHCASWAWGVIPLVDFRYIATFPHLQSLSLGFFSIAYEWQIDWILAHRSTLRELCFDQCAIDPIIINYPPVSDSLDPYETGRVTMLGSVPDTALVPGQDYHAKYCDLRWHDVFDRIRTEMTGLQHFIFSFSNHSTSHDDWFLNRYSLASSTDSQFRYLSFDGEDWIHHNPVIERHRRKPESRAPEHELHYTEDGELKPECLEQDKEALKALLKKVTGNEELGVPRKDWLMASN